MGFKTNLQSNNTDLQTILNAINELPEAIEEPIFQSKTVTPTTSQQSVTPDSGYDGLSKVTVNAMPTATQATPSISVSSNGLITANATQTEGYVAAGTKSATKQLTVETAKTVTPTASNQTVVASGRYTTGAIIVKGDTNLKAENIAEGISIFGISGTHSGGDTNIEDGLITKTLSGNYINDRVDTVASYAFAYCSSLRTVSFPECYRIQSCAFQNCTSLTSVSFPRCTYMYNSAFYDCSSLTTVSFPKCTTIYRNAFQSCSSLTTVSFPACKYIYSSAFQKCTNLSSIYLGASTVCTLSHSNAFSSTAIGNTKGSIYVPSSLVASYKAATNWTYFSNRIYSMP